MPAHLPATNTKGLPATTKQPAAPATVAPAVTPPARGLVTASRWAVGIKASGLPAGTGVTLAQHIKALPHNAVITCQRNSNPKLRGSTTPANLYKFGGVVGQWGVGLTTTLGQYIANLTNPHNGATYGGQSMAFKHVAWDVNHGYITIQGINGVAPAAPIAPPAAPAVAPATQAA